MVNPGYCCKCLYHVAAQPKRSEKPSCLFQSLEFFVDNLALVGIEGALKCFEGPTEPPILSPRDEELYVSAKCDLIMYIIQFVGVLVDHHHNSPTSVRTMTL